MKKIITVLILVLFFATIVSADLIMPGEKHISICNKITNIDEYSSNYYISIGMIARESAILIKQNECISGDDFYKFQNYKVYVIPKSELSESELNSLLAMENIDQEKFEMSEYYAKIIYESKNLEISKLVDDSPEYQDYTVEYIIAYVGNQLTMIEKSAIKGDPVEVNDITQGSLVSDANSFSSSEDSSMLIWIIAAFIAALAIAILYIKLVRK